MVNHVKQVLRDSTPPVAPGFAYRGVDRNGRLLYTTDGAVVVVDTGRSRFSNAHDNVVVLTIDATEGVNVDYSNWAVTARPYVASLSAARKLTWPLVRACIDDLCGL